MKDSVKFVFDEQNVIMQNGSTRKKSAQIYSNLDLQPFFTLGPDG